MPKNFKKIYHKRSAHVLKHKTGQLSIPMKFFIEKHRQPHRLKLVKDTFLTAVYPENIGKSRKEQKRDPLNSFLFIIQEQLEVRKGGLNEYTHKNYEIYCNRFLFPVLGDLPIVSIKTIERINIMSTVQERVYENLCVILNSILNMLLPIVLFPIISCFLFPLKSRTQQQTRLTNDELKKFLEGLNLSEFKQYRQTFLIFLFFGLHPCKLENTSLEGDFLIARNKAQRR